MGIIHIPESATPPERPHEPAANYPAGSIWESGDKTQWMVVWDDQDKRLIWEQIKVKGT